jgi:hypothetical protein
MIGAPVSHRRAYDGPREYDDDPRPDLHYLGFNVKLREVI